ncbi:helix-turn-helix domain-containing protein [Aeromicrobium sp. Root495]|uniref:helix-turn-helix domain-containing protein n=1 Tax=Aeromicrobium sp. Root495 TaxID=1736550 RepID=UPI0009EA8E17|nr:helix-turn-helix transcriptional regulator [Aeromicrobium sp. Root495]
MSDDGTEASTPFVLVTIAERLVACRKARGWTQQDLADRSGVHRVSILKAEAGRIDLRATSLQRLATALGVDVGDLFPRLPSLDEAADRGRRGHATPTASGGAAT